MHKSQVNSRALSAIITLTGSSNIYITLTRTDKTLQLDICNSLLYFHYMQFLVTALELIM